MPSGSAGRGLRPGRPGAVRGAARRRGPPGRPCLLHSAVRTHPAGRRRPRWRTSRTPAQGIQRVRGPFVAVPDERRPAAAVDEDVIEGGASQEVVVGRVDDRQTAGEGGAQTVRKLELDTLVGLAAGRENAHPVFLPAGYVPRLELRWKHEVHAEDVIEGPVAEDRFT